MRTANLDDILAGSLCVSDSDVLLCAEQGVSSQAQRFIRRCASGELKGVLPQSVWQELTHKLMLAEAMMRGVALNSSPANAIPEVIRGLTLYRTKVKSLIDLGFGFESCQPSDLFERALPLQERYGLLINKAVLLAVAIRLKAQALISIDRTLSEITEIDFY